MTVINLEGCKGRYYRANFKSQYLLTCTVTGCWKLWKIAVTPFDLWMDWVLLGGHVPLSVPWTIWNAGWGMQAHLCVCDCQAQLLITSAWLYTQIYECILEERKALLPLTDILALTFQSCWYVVSDCLSHPQVIASLFLLLLQYILLTIFCSVSGKS